MNVLLYSPTKFVKLVEPFLLVITHPEILACLSVDTAVGSLYNFVSGSNGSRAIPFFQRLIQNLLGAVLGETQRCGVLNPAYIALQELLRREGRARFHDDLPGLVDSIEPTAEAIGIDKNGTTFAAMAPKIAALKGIIARAQGLLHEDVQPTVSGVSATLVTSTYPRAIVVPGNRHDNDKLDIAEISIIPTESEIRSNHAEFLPSTDLDQPHFLADQAQRHIDTHFRLLRHDIFGELKESLRVLIVAIENNPALLTQSSLCLSNIRAYIYHGAYIIYLSMNGRHYIVAQISFLQPSINGKKSKAELSRWWGESKRLEDGVLLCFLSFDNSKTSILFFTVSGKDTDPKHPNSLANAYQATTTGKLASLSQTKLDLLVQHSCSKARGILFELPVVILAMLRSLRGSMCSLYI